MSAPLGYYDQSLPPELWETPPLVGAAARRSVPAADLDEPTPPGLVEVDGAELVADEGDAAGEPLPEVDPSSYPPDAVDLEPQPAVKATPRKAAGRPMSKRRR